VRVRALHCASETGKSTNCGDSSAQGLKGALGT
jgi:hypothetical protein